MKIICSMGVLSLSQSYNSEYFVLLFLTILRGLLYWQLNVPLSFRDPAYFQETPCIRCARCVDACPMQLLPLEYPKYVNQGKFSDMDAINIKDCIECGSCAYVCPARIPIVHYVKVGKFYAA